MQSTTQMPTKPSIGHLRTTLKNLTGAAVSPTMKYEELEAKIKEIMHPAKKERAPKADSKVQKLIAAISTKGGATMDAILKASGFDKKNASVSISILKKQKGFKITRSDVGIYSLAV